MNKKLELDMSELLIAAANGKVNRMAKIFARLDFAQKERLATGLLRTLSKTFDLLPGKTVLDIQKDFGFELVKEEVT